jgi:DNA replication protein DnaC
MIRFFDDEELLATCQESEGKHQLVGSRLFYEQLQRDQEQARRKYGRRKGAAPRGLTNASLFSQVGRCIMEQLINDRLQENLSRLKLTRAAEVLDAIVAKAEADKSSYPAFLDHLLEEEVAAKDKRRVQTAMKTAGLPAAKSIEEYDFSFHPKLNKKHVMSLFDLDFIRQKENVIFLGPPGVGKTHLAISLAIKACYHGFKVYFATMDTLMRKLKETPSKRKAYLASALVVVD